MTLAPGARLGPYEVIGLIGSGGMGEVYRARDTRLDRTVAVKVMHAGFATEPTLRARFEREARAIAALQHPHICTLHDIGEADGQAYLVMEHLSGETLASRLCEGRLPLAHGGVTRFDYALASVEPLHPGRGQVHVDRDGEAHAGRGRPSARHRRDCRVGAGPPTKQQRQDDPARNPPTWAMDATPTVGAVPAMEPAALPSRTSRR